MKSFKVIASLLLSAVVLSLAGCSSSRHDTDEKYFLVSANLQVPYWKTAGAGFSQAATQLGVRAEFVGPNTYDPAAQKEAFDAAVQQKATGILISVADPNLMKDSIDRAIGAGIPVITVDSDAPASKRLFFIGTNNYQAGVLGGQRLAQELHNTGNVVVFTMPGQANMEERLRGYKDGLEKAPQVQDRPRRRHQGRSAGGVRYATQIVGKDKDKVNAFVCLEAQAGKEVANVISGNNVKGKVVMAFDTDPDTLDWIKKGVIAATISQKPYSMTYVGLKMLDDLFHNKPKSLDQDWAKDSFAVVPAFIDTGSSLVDKSNVDAFMQVSKSVTGGQQ